MRHTHPHNSPIYICIYIHISCTDFTEASTNCSLAKEKTVHKTESPGPRWFSVLQGILSDSLFFPIHINVYLFDMGLSRWHSGKESACNADVGSIPGSWRSPGVGTQPTPVFLPGKFHGYRSLAGYSPWGLNVSDMTKWLERTYTHTHTHTHTEHAFDMD